MSYSHATEFLCIFQCFEHHHTQWGIWFLNHVFNPFHFKVKKINTAIFVWLMQRRVLYILVVLEPQRNCLTKLSNSFHSFSSGLGITERNENDALPKVFIITFFHKEIISFYHLFNVFLISINFGV